MNKKRIEELKNLPLERNNYHGPGLGHRNRLDVSGFAQNVWPRISKYFNDNSNILDVGAGNGRFSKFISNHVKSVRAFDSHVSIVPEHTAENITFSKESVEDFGEGTFDVVFLFGVFYMFGFPENINIFEKLYNMLNSGGFLIIIDSYNNDKIHYDLEKYSEAYGGTVVETFLQRCEEQWPHRITVIKKHV